MSETSHEPDKAEVMAREMIVPSMGGPWDAVVPLSVHEKADMRALVHRLNHQPEAVRDDIRNGARVFELAGSTKGGQALGLREEFRALARRHPAEFEEVCGGNMATEAREAVFRGIAPQSEVARE